MCIFTLESDITRSLEKLCRLNRFNFLNFLFILYVDQYKAGAPYREGSELSLKKAKREQTEEEAGSRAQKFPSRNFPLSSRKELPRKGSS